MASKLDLTPDARSIATMGESVGWCVYLVGEGLLETRSMPAAGKVVVGRGQDAELRIDDESISRRHAVLHLEPPLRVEDLGSRNGTVLAGRRLASGEVCEVPTGAAIQVGNVTIVIQKGVAPVRPRRLWAHGAFEARVEGECARGERRNITFAIARIVVDDPAQAAEVAQLVLDSVRAEDMVAHYAPGEYELLLVEITRADADAVVAKLTEKFRERAIPARISVAAFPQDGRTAEQLILHCGQTLRGKSDSAWVVVRDPAMQQLHQMVERVATGTISVLLLGETGVGKEVLAETLHRRSPRASKPFLRLNCTSLSETLLESELFGHEKGAFTGAVTTKPGLLETADGGTVFLDEIGELPLAVQVKLLRVLEERRVLRIGSVKQIAIDVRFVSATHRDLEAHIRAGQFREDLYFRLNGFSLVIPPLRERTSEIEPLARAFLIEGARMAARTQPPELSSEAVSLLRTYSWPGNIRELRNVIQRAVLLCSGDTITPELLPLDKMTSRAPTYAPVPAHEPVGRREALVEELKLLERETILDALARAGGNQSKAAKVLGISRNTLLNHMDRLKLPRPRKGPPK